MHDILPGKGMCSELRDLFKFWELCDNISETVQNKDTVALGNLICGLSNDTIANAFE